MIGKGRGDQACQGTGSHRRISLVSPEQVAARVTQFDAQHGSHGCCIRQDAIFLQRLEVSCVGQHFAIHTKSIGVATFTHTGNREDAGKVLFRLNEQQQGRPGSIDVTGNDGRDTHDCDVLLQRCVIQVLSPPERRNPAALFAKDAGEAGMPLWAQLMTDNVLVCCGSGKNQAGRIDDGEAEVAVGIE